MKHHILIKFNDKVINKKLLINEIASLFAQAKGIPGVHEVSILESVIDLPNRYDIMIVMDMEKEALTVYDASNMHKYWKSEYSKYLESKAIFDCD